MAQATDASPLPFKWHGLRRAKAHRVNVPDGSAEKPPSDADGCVQKVSMYKAIKDSSK
jgi:hypothetical protein